VRLICESVLTAKSRSLLESQQTREQARKPLQLDGAGGAAAGAASDEVSYRQKALKAMRSPKSNEKRGTLRRLAVTALPARLSALLHLSERASSRGASNNSLENTSSHRGSQPAPHQPGRIEPPPGDMPTRSHASLGSERLSVEGPHSSIGQLRLSSERVASEQAHASSGEGPSPRSRAWRRHADAARGSLPRRPVPRSSVEVTIPRERARTHARQHPGPFV